MNKGSYDDARGDVRALARKTRRFSPAARLAALLAWAGDDIDEIRELIEDDDETDSRKNKPR